MTAADVTASSTSLGDIADMADDLAGIHPALDTITTALARLAAADLTTEQTAIVLAALAGPGPSALAVLAATVAHLGNAAANPALADLTPARKTDITTLTAQYALYLDKCVPAEFIGEAVAAIEDQPYSATTE